MTDYRGKKCIIRAETAGVFFGEVVDVVQNTVELANARRIWYWEGANSCSDLALIGTTKPDKCKFTAPVDDICILNIAEIIPCTETAITSIEGVPEWTQKTNSLLR